MNPKAITSTSIHPEDVERFWSKVPVKTTGECWQWTGTISKKMNRAAFFWNGTMGIAARFCYAATRGDIPEGQCVCHHCDNPGCVNPDHMFLGTKGDNNKDKIEKGRSARGAKAGKVKLTEDQVRSIRLEYRRGKRGFGTPALAKKYGIAHQNIMSIINRNNWGWLK